MSSDNSSTCRSSRPTRSCGYGPLRRRGTRTLRSVRLPLSARGRRPKQLLIAWEKLNGKLGPRAFQDVHEGGPAHVAGLRPGDILLQVRDRELRAPEPPIFPVGEESQYAVQKPDWKAHRRHFERPLPTIKEPSRSRPKSSVVLSNAGRNWLVEGDHVPRGGRQRPWQDARCRVCPPKGLNAPNCGPSREHRWRHRRPSPHELSDARNKRGWIQPDTRAQRKGICPREVAQIRPDTITQGNASLAGAPIRIHRQIDPRCYRRARTATIPRPRRHSRQRAHIKCGRNGRRLCAGERPGNHRGNKERWPPLERQRLQSGVWLLVGSSRCRLPNVGRQADRRQRSIPRHSCRTLARRAEKRRRFPNAHGVANCPRHVSAACHDLYYIIPAKVASYQGQGRSFYCVNLATNSEVQWQLLRLHLGSCALFLFPSCLFLPCPPGEGRLSGAFTSLLWRQFGGSDLSPF